MDKTVISFGLPVNRTIELDCDDSVLENIESFFSFKNPSNLKIILHCTHEQKSNFNEKDFCKTLLKNDNVKSVKIIYDVKRETHIRSKKIIEAKTNKDKLEEYLSVNKIKASSTLFDKLKDIEDNLEIKHFVPCHSFTLLKCEVRGSIGIKEGTGREELSIDFNQYEDGIIALVGASGSGKSTFIENCHPYPQMLTRNGKLQDHFYLKDSYRKLTYCDEAGTFYKIEIFIDGSTKNGKCKYFVYKGKSLDTLESVKDCDGNSEPYISWVNNNFGSIDLFLRTAYFANKKTGTIPDITEAKKGEKKALFSSLIGIDGLELISVKAKDVLKQLKKDSELIENKIQDINEDDMSLEDYDDVIKEIEDKIASLNKEKSELETELTSKESDLKRLAEVKDNKVTLENEVKTFTTELSAVKNDLDFITSYDIDKTDTYIKSYKEFEDFVREHTEWLETVLVPARESYNKLEHDIELLKSEVEHKKDLASRYEIPDIKDECPTCKQKLPATQIALLKQKYDDKVAYKRSLEDEVAKKEKELNSLMTEYEHHPYLEAEKKMDEEERIRIEREGALNGQFNIDEVKRDRERYESLDEQFLRDKVSSLENSIKRDSAMLSDLSSADFDSLESEVKELKDKIKECKESEERCYRLLGTSKADKNQLKTKIENNKTFEEQLKDINKSMSEYELLSKAFGPDGIAALELEAISPEIADITNDILNEAYGDKFKVSFQTLRQGSDGHYIEDFSILVENTKSGLTRPLEWLSGGETVWIKEALYHAFSIIRAKSTNFSMNTKMLDESDGALDSVSRLQYLNMIKAAHKEGGVRHTILITHSQELKDVIEQIIKF